MSVRLAESSLFIDTAAPDYTVAYTLALWLRRAGDSAFGLGVSGDNGTYSDQIAWSDATISLSTEAGDDSAPNMPSAVWHFCALRRADGDTLQLLVDGTVTRAMEGDATTRLPASLIYIDSYNPDTITDVVYLRVWQAALTDGELALEMASETPVRTADLWADWPLTLHTDLTDHSGNGRDLTAVGTIATADNPPVGPPPGAATGFLNWSVGGHAGLSMSALGLRVNQWVHSVLGAFKWHAATVSPINHNTSVIKPIQWSHMAHDGITFVAAGINVLTISATGDSHGTD